MLIKFISLGGYGFYVWPAFIFTFTFLVLFYLKTKKELREQENLFLNEFKQLKTIKIEVAKSKEIKKKILSGSSI